MPQVAKQHEPLKYCLLSADQLPKGTARLAIRDLFVAGWNNGEGVTVCVRELAGSEIEVWQRVMRHVGSNPPIDDVLDYLMCAICTPSGDRIFTSEADREALKGQSLAVLFSIFTKAMETATVSTAAVAAEKKDSKTIR